MIYLLKRRDKFNLSKQLQRALSVARADEGAVFWDCGSEACGDRYLEDDADTLVNFLVVCSPESILCAAPLIRYPLVIV